MGEIMKSKVIGLVLMLTTSITVIASTDSIDIQGCCQGECIESKVEDKEELSKASIDGVKRDSKESVNIEHNKAIIVKPDSAGRFFDYSEKVRLTLDECLDMYDYSNPIGKTHKVNETYFDDAVFLGNSRTEGLIINTGLSNTRYYAHKGLTVASVFTENVINFGKGKTTAINALKNTDFSKVYIMYGINETGWQSEAIFIDDYRKIIKEIRDTNPEAYIYVQSILPVSKKMSQSNRYINNTRISELNELLKTMCFEERVFYVDVYSDVCDSNCDLPPEGSVDGVHLTKDYCKLWLESLESHTFNTELFE